MFFFSWFIFLCVFLFVLFCLCGFLCLFGFFFIYLDFFSLRFPLLLFFKFLGGLCVCLFVCVFVCVCVCVCVCLYVYVFSLLLKLFYHVRVLNLNTMNLKIPHKKHSKFLSNPSGMERAVEYIFIFRVIRWAFVVVIV